MNDIKCENTSWSIHGRVSDVAEEKIKLMIPFGLLGE